MAKKKQEVKLKEPVRIRFKQLANGNQSIYLDYYTGDVIRKENYVGGKRQYEFLKLYLIPEKTREDKAKNETTLALAKAIQSKRIVELQNDAHGFQNTNKSKANVIDYLVNMRSQSKERGSLNYEKTVGNTIRELKLFRGDYIAFRDIDKDFLNSFVDFLKQAKKASKFGLLKAGGVLSNNSVIAYYGVLRTAINRAYKEGIITVNPTKEFDFASKVKAEVSRREYLTIEELRQLIGTECKYEIMKQAFLFSCLCGLRVSDIRNLKWNDLQKSGERIRIEIKMQKTKEPLYLPISDEALKWLPQQNEAKGDDLIFPLTHEGTINKILQKWAKDAGVIKHISFHVARHTHATMMLTLGADLYTVSKLLGHKNIATTQIYAKIVDKKKEELEHMQRQEIEKLEAISGLSAEEAKERMVESLKEEAKTQAQSYINDIMDDAKLTASKEAKRIVIQSIQRVATETAIENSVTVFHIESDEIKGRIIGREGRNIRALEAATGVEIVVDDTPEAIVLSAFDPVRREIARLALHQLVTDGRIHPARIEEVVAKVRKQVEEEIIETGKRTTIDLGIHGLHPELIRIIGKMKYRSS